MRIDDEQLRGLLHPVLIKQDILDTRSVKKKKTTGIKYTPSGKPSGQPNLLMGPSQSQDRQP